MTLSEFKAWFEGFTENIEGEPTAKQWKKIKSRVAEINGNSVTERYFYDHYWHRPWVGPWYSTTYGLSATAATGALGLATSSTAWSGERALLALGHADAQEAA